MFDRNKAIAATYNSKVFPGNATGVCYIVNVPVDGLLLTEEFRLAVIDVASDL